VRPPSEFVHQIADAYEKIYDLAYLRTHPLCDLLVPARSLAPRDRAWRLHHLLLEVIGDLAPGPQVPVLSRQWRRHRLLTLRYVDALEPDAVMEELSISRRHYYREHNLAMEALATILWERRQPVAPAAQAGLSPAIDEQASLSQLELLRREAARLAQASRCANVGTTLQHVLPLLQNMLTGRGIALTQVVAEGLPSVAIDESMLRQLLLGTLEYLVKYVAQTAIDLSARACEQTVRLTLRMEPARDAEANLAQEAEERLMAVTEMAALSGARLQVLRTGSAVLILDLELPVAQRTVLLVDDNEDALELFRRYLSANHYQVATARTAQEALDKVRQLRPYAITLDLMMPGQDGWDLLQILLSQPETHQIPIIICTVLKQKDLALSLGAAAFLEKPVSEQALLDALASFHQF